VAGRPRHPLLTDVRSQPVVAWSRQVPHRQCSYRMQTAAQGGISAVARLGERGELLKELLKAL